MSRLPVIALLWLAAGAGTAAPDRIIIPHGTHFENDVACLDCHAGVESSRAAGEVFRPDMDVCADCHEVEDDGSCTMCHTDPDKAGDYPARVFGAAKFVHAPHVERGLDCAACHGDPAADHPSLPGKADCRVCHETGDAYADCLLCHAPDEAHAPASHTPSWRDRHGLQARDDAALCARCHSETTCQECHAGDNVRPRSHGLNYAFDHALDARANALECAVCHDDPEYCSACHRAEHVLPRSHASAGWLGGPDGGQHARDGVFELESCIACHSEGDGSATCAACHGG